MGSTGWCRTRSSRTGTSCRSGRRVQSDVRPLSTITAWNRRTIGSTDNPKMGTTEPKIAMGTSDGAKGTAATAAKVCWPATARVCWSTAARVRWPTAVRVHWPTATRVHWPTTARVRWPTAVRVHWSAAARVQRVPLTDRKWEHCKRRRHRFGFMQRCGMQRARAGVFRLRCWWILRRVEETTCHGSSSNPSKNVMVGESR